MSRSVRVTLSGPFAVAAAGMLLLAGVGGRQLRRDLLPGMLIVGVGLGVALVGVAVAVLTARDDETGMLSGLNTTGHEIGGSLGVAVLVSIATAAVGGAASPASPAQSASGLGDAYLAGASCASASRRLSSCPPPAASCPGCGWRPACPSTDHRMPPTHNPRDSACVRDGRTPNGA